MSAAPTTVQEVMSMMERGRSNLETQLSCLTTLEKMVELDGEWGRERRGGGREE